MVKMTDENIIRYRLEVLKSGINSYFFDIGPYWDLASVKGTLRGRSADEVDVNNPIIQEAFKKWEREDKYGLKLQFTL